MRKRRTAVRLTAGCAMLAAASVLVMTGLAAGPAQASVTW